MTKATVVYDGRETSLEPVEATGAELWLRLADLHTATGWELKPEGVCKEETCVPVTDALRRALLGPVGDTFNLTEFARHIEQPFAHDEVASASLFGAPGWEWRSGLPASHLAPDFTLPDLDGKPFSLSRLEGKKVFLLFWATW